MRARVESQTSHAAWSAACSSQSCFQPVPDAHPSQALALAPYNIRVNAVAPGSIMTDVLASVATDAAARERILSRTPMGRIGEPEEVASVVTFLASSAASYMTGQARAAALRQSSRTDALLQIVYVDGGRMALNYTVPVPKADE